MNPRNKIFYLLVCILLGSSFLHAQSFKLQTKFAILTVNEKGFITSVKNKQTGKEYCPKGMSSALMSLEAKKKYILPQKALYNSLKNEILLTYSNGAVAHIKAEQKKQYLRFQLLSLNSSAEIDNIVWGPYKTNISKIIGDVIGVVRDDDFAIGLLGIDDNTTSGPPTDGDMSFMYYFIHSPDPVKIPLPSHLKEGQTFSIGGDGVNDIAFYSQPEEYYRMNYGNGAKLEPEYGSSVCMHSRDRRKEQMIRFPAYPENVEGKANSSRYQLVTATNAHFINSSVAFYACPDSLGLKTIETIVINEGLPHITVDGKWIRDPLSYRPDIAWWGVHDSIISYCAQLGIKSVQDEGWGEYYPNPANKWGNRRINFKGGVAMSVPAFGAMMQQNEIRYGLHTLCEFLQPNNNSDVSPVPSDSLAIMQRTMITNDITTEDTVITIADTAYFNEFGGWEGNHTNVLKIGKELIEYDGVTKTIPFTFIHVKRGFQNTSRGAYKAGTTIVKLQPNCYRGFAPDMNLQEVYAAYYGKWLAEGGMDYIDFDGLESCMYQGHGQYSFKRFFRKLFETYHQSGGKYLRVMGSAVSEGNWHYMSVCNVGGGDHMFNPVYNKWGIEGKDMRYVFQSSYLPATFGIINLNPQWSIYDAENLQAKSIGWDAMYMLGLSEETVEKCAEKEKIFHAIHVWENARTAQIFTKALKEKLKNLDYKFHLEQKDSATFLLYPVKENRFSRQPYTLKKQSFILENGFSEQTLDMVISISSPDSIVCKGLKIKFSNGQEIIIEKKLFNGDLVIYNDHVLYIADKNRKKKEVISTGGAYRLPKGKSGIEISALQEGNTLVSYELLVSVVGVPEMILAKQKK